MQNAHQITNGIRLPRVKWGWIVFSSLYLFLMYATTLKYVEYATFRRYGLFFEPHTLPEGVQLNKFVMLFNWFILLFFFTLRTLINEGVIVDNSAIPNYIENKEQRNQAVFMQVITSIVLAIHFSLYYILYIREEQTSLYKHYYIQNAVIARMRLDYFMIICGLLVQIFFYKKIEYSKAIKSIDKIMISAIVLAISSLTIGMKVLFIGNLLVLSILCFHITTMIYRFMKPNKMDITPQLDNKTLSIGVVILLGFSVANIINLKWVKQFQKYHTRPTWLRVPYVFEAQRTFKQLMILAVIITWLVSSKLSFERTRSIFKKLTATMVTYHALIEYDDDFYYDIMRFGEAHGMLLLEDFVAYQLPALVSLVLGIRMILLYYSINPELMLYQTLKRVYKRLNR